MTENAHAASVKTRATSVFLIAVLSVLVCVGVTVGFNIDRPAHGDDVLINVPASGLTSMRTIRHHLAMARRSGDPMHLMAARASMQRAWRQITPTAESKNELAVLNATILQAGHQFEEAISQLNAVLVEQPGNQHALLLLASIQRVVGDYQSARLTCNRLSESGASIAGQVCVAELDSLTGDKLAYQRVKDSVLDHLNRRTTDRAIAHWAYLVMAAMADRADYHNHAQRHYLSALLIEPTVYAISQYAGWLIQHQRFAAAASLLERNGATSEHAADVLKINLAIALHGKEMHADAQRIVDALRRQWATDSSDRSRHWRERAIAALRLFDDPLAAARFAERNWQEQREPEDLQLLVDAAIASNRADLLRLAAQFVAQTGFVDPALIGQIHGAEL